MALGNEFPVVTTGNMYTAIDTYASTVSTQPPTNTPSNPNGAQNPIGAAFLLAPGAYFSPAVYYPGGTLNANGWGAPMVVRYVRYNSTANPAILAAPAPVYWTDETYSTVTGKFSEGNPAATGNLNSFAGILLVNTAAYPGSKTGAQLATILNGNFCFIVTRGFVPGVTAPTSTAIGDSLTGSGDFIFTRTASGTAPISRFNCIAQTALSGSNTVDVLVNTEISL